MDVALQRAGNAEMALSTKELQGRLSLIQELMRDVLVENLDFGTIPGTPKPTIYKPGAEKLAVMFRLRVNAPVVEEDEYKDGGISYRVQVPVLGNDGRVLAVGIGEASSNEEKYKWRAAVCEQEWQEAPEHLRRNVWKKGRGGGAPSQVKQIRTNPEDQANTVLKLAHKRGYIHGVIMATGASSIFDQDLEDLEPDQRQSNAATSAASTNHVVGSGASNPNVISEAQGKRLFAKRRAAGVNDEHFANWLAKHYPYTVELDNDPNDKLIKRADYDAICNAVDAKLKG